MAMDFPNAPTVGQQFIGPDGNIYQWDGVKWEAAGGGGTAGGGGFIPTPPALAGTIVAQELAVNPILNYNNVAGNHPSFIGLNLYNDLSGTVRYLDNGAGALIATHAVPPGIGGDPTLGRMAIQVALPNTGGKGVAATNQNLLGELNLCAVPAVGGGTVPAGQVSPFTVIGDNSVIPVLAAGQYPLIHSLLATQFSVRPTNNLFGISGNNVSFIGLNVFVDQLDNIRYLDNGPGAQLDARFVDPSIANPTARLNIAVAAPNTAGVGAGASLIRGAVSIVGPLDPANTMRPFVSIGDGSHWPSPVPSGGWPLWDTLEAQQLIVRPILGYKGIAGNNVTYVNFNEYIDQTGVVRYLDNGPSGQLGAHILANDVEAGRLILVVGLPNDAGQYTIVPTEQQVGAVNIVGYPDGAGGIQTFVILGDDSLVEPLAGRYPRPHSLITSELVARADPIPPTNERASRLGLNSYFNGITGVFTYNQDGPAGIIGMQEMYAGLASSAHFRFGVQEPAAAGTVMTPQTALLLWGPAQYSATQGNTALSIGVNNNAGMNVVPVTLGAQGSGGTGFRALLVPN